MDTESAGTIRDAFLFDVHRQFEGLSRWVATQLTAFVSEDGREAIFAVTEGNYELLRFTVTFEIGASSDKRWDLSAKLMIEEPGSDQDVNRLRTADQDRRRRVDHPLGCKDGAPRLEACSEA
jgi:hypothetical protein